jgi:HPr kinase/phosphorylase
MTQSQPKFVESISVSDFFESFRKPLQMELVAGAKGMNNVVEEKSINRPALALTGFFTYFATERIQLFGAGEIAYLKDRSEDEQLEILRRIAELKIPCIIVSRGLIPTSAMMRVAQDYGIPLIQTPLTSKVFITQATVMLEDRFAPRITEHGTMMDIRGIGTLLRGRSGVGKSECALALIERGHSLVADDFIYIKLMGDQELIATSSELNQGYMECRGLGIINIAELFGVRSVRREKRVDMVVSFVEWEPGLEEDRTGLEENFYTVLGQDVPHFELPVRPGRDLARLVEVGTMVQALKSMGHHAAREFNERLIAHMQEEGQSI